MRKEKGRMILKEINKIRACKGKYPIVVSWCSKQERSSTSMNFKIFLRMKQKELSAVLNTGVGGCASDESVVTQAVKRG